jgi:hypothetical protein
MTRRGRGLDWVRAELLPVGSRADLKRFHRYKAEMSLNVGPRAQSTTRLLGRAAP